LIAWVALAVLVIGAIVLTNTSWRRRQIVRDLSANVEGADRHVDVGVILRVVVQDLNGTELIEGKPKLRVLREHHFGGIVDTKLSTPDIIGPSQNPRIWHCSEEQEQIILHRDTEPLGQLVYGSEGAGKTTALVLWTYLRWLEQLGERREIGITAPTQTRIETVLREFTLQFSSSWYRYQSSAGTLTLCDGTRLRLVSTYRQSKAQGSPVQGFNWSAAGRDEGQDQVDVHEDIESRGRSAKDGKYKQLITATAKDDPTWRTLRDQLDAAKHKDGAPLWIRRTLFGRSSPFIDPSFWDSKLATMSRREYDRRVLAKDVGPERATYLEWSRETNLITVPSESGTGIMLGWEDVTARELRAFGPAYSMLVGHDPGTLWDVSLFLRAYVKSRDSGLYATGKCRPFWVVIGELNTEQSTTEHHVSKLLERVRKTWRLNLLSSSGRTAPDAPQILVRADPAGNNDQRTDKSVYTQFANAGIRIKPAAYNAEHTGHGRVPREAGVELVNTLLCSASNDRRLFVARMPDGSPAAPKLVAALESSERDSDGKAENQRKGEGDVSHWPAALRYALWAIERPRLKLLSKEDA
jgi:hypothetical protein